MRSASRAALIRSSSGIVAPRRPLQAVRARAASCEREWPARPGTGPERAGVRGRPGRLGRPAGPRRTPHGIPGYRGARRRVPRKRNGQRSCQVTSRSNTPCAIPCGVGREALPDVGRVAGWAELTPDSARRLVAAGLACAQPAVARMGAGGVAAGDPGPADAGALGLVSPQRCCGDRPGGAALQPG